MGVVYLLLYLAGGGLLTLSVSRFLQDALNGAPLAESAPLVALGMGLVCFAALLHAVTLRRRNPDGPSAALPRMGRVAFALAGVMWAMPILIGWLQFELFINPIQMAPHLMFLGGLFLVFCVCTHVTATWRMPVVATTAGVALFGLPLGLLGAALPIGHFNHHLSDVVLLMSDPMTGEDRSVLSERADVPMPPQEMNPHKNVMDLAAALGNARQINIEEELAAGRMKQLDDGSYVVVNPDGSEAALESAAAFDEALDEAVEADKRQAFEAEAARVAEWERQMRQRRPGGRLFTKATAD
ncbi:hypothetical protein A176_006066 [Myxococcus hansupus]|uniref:Uncharacterized protein n=1 Tax=Pseudomyxococcus hansupus TaxID=1297742 RepID=A0A0H4X1Z0_9BACT|nr:hypothetical protein [Myxococcus hansupus]AKQ69154.1 hypothetical protein A176_006066 [Myxococcus hansupus]